MTECSPNLRRTIHTGVIVHSMSYSMTEPLYLQLVDLDREISCQMDANAALKAKIQHNEDKINKLFAAKTS